MDTTWLNGVRIGGDDRWSAPRRYDVPSGVLRAGRNVIAVRVLDTGGNGGITGGPDQFGLEDPSGARESVNVSGEWSYRETTPLNRLRAVPQRPGSNPNVVTVLYNGMIAPLVPFAIKGAIWYQGESNAGRALQYRRLLPTMIEDWRSSFDVGDFPFLVVQLANFMAPQKEPSEGGWAYLREAQLLTAQADPKVGLAVAIDIGEANDIHPRNKQDVGFRLALSALEIAYGRKVVSSGPEYAGMDARGNEIVLRFRNVGGGLVARGADALKGFAIAGKDKAFVWADAAIRGDTVVVSSPKISEPAAVRYGWANNPRGNLYNKEGLPASPVRTDVDAP
jgi:sialate O-acetylesterase